MSETTETQTEPTPEQTAKLETARQAFVKNRLLRFVALIKEMVFFGDELQVAEEFCDVCKAIAHKKPLVLDGESLSEHEKNKYLRDKLGWGHFRIPTMQFKIGNSKLKDEVRGILAAYCNGLQAKIEEVEPPVKVEESTTPKGPYIIDAGKPTLEAVQ